MAYARFGDDADIYVDEPHREGDANDAWIAEQDPSRDLDDRPHAAALSPRGESNS